MGRSCPPQMGSIGSFSFPQNTIFPIWGAVSELLKQLDSLHSYDLLNQYAMKFLTIAPDNPKAYCWLIRSLKAQGMNELATNELAAAKEHLTTEEYEEILAFGANW